MAAIGLLLEAWKPSLDFSLNKEGKWLFASIILFSVLICLNVWWWFAHGLAMASNQGRGAAVSAWFLGLFTTDTSILSLLFGTLFLTNSSPRKSLSYQLMLVGAVIHNLFLFPLYAVSALGIRIIPDPRMADFWGNTIFQPWFWCDLISEVVIFAGAVWLLKTSMNVKKLILAFLLVFLCLFVLSAAMLLRP